MGEWLRPILGAALLVAGAAGLAYKVISGYQHASPDAFFSVHDQNRLPAASAVDHPPQAATVPVHVPAPAQSPTKAAQTATGAAPRAPPLTAAPPPASGDTLPAIPS